MKDGQEKSSSSNEPDTKPKFFSNPLPGNSKWNPEDWPIELHVHVRTIASFKYPAAIFWGPDLTLLYNYAWQEAGGIDEQGEPQRGSLSADGWHALHAALIGSTPQRITSEDVLRDASTHDEGAYRVLISPLFSTGRNPEIRGVLAQLVTDIQDSPAQPRRQINPRMRSFGDNRLDERIGEAKRRGDLDVPNKAVDNVPLDEHPFFHRFAEMLPTGLAILDHAANAVFVNQIWYNMTTHRGPSQDFKSWPESIYGEDRQRVLDAYKDAFESGKQLRTEFRSSEEGKPWRLLLLIPLGDENLQHVSFRVPGGFICSIVDITSEKKAELAERESANEAKHRRIQQEKFMDMISHEIRNPLSAILHCIEDIDDAVKSPESIDIPAIHEAVETINLCVNHQKAIVDDVLSFSKLDSSMLNLAPKPCRLKTQMAGSVKMFQPEMKKHNIEYQYIIDTSYVEHKIDWVMCDLARISQVLVNLISNSIKFTSRSDSEKKITISVGCSHERPTSYPPNVVFFAQDEHSYHLDATTRSEDWGNGDVFYIMVAVKDTGIGISEEGQLKLFKRFRQATPKTEEQYGGSGLGLSISRKLCHLHGGEIGVSAKEGHGSTFAFFFKVRKTDPSDERSDKQAQVDEEQEAADQQIVQQEVVKLGNADPDEARDEEQPHSLQHTVVEETMIHRPGTDDPENDDRYEQTKKAASKVPEEDSDKYKAVDEHGKSHSKAEEKQPSGIPAVGKENDLSVRQILQHKVKTPASTYDTDKAHVLLVEDNVINQRIVARKLQAKGYRVTTANNGQDAVRAMQSSSQSSDGPKCVYNVILMDQEMPIMDGNAATKAIRQLETKGEIDRVPIIGVSANTRVEQQDTMRDSGMDDVVSKPYKIDDLVSKIKQYTIK